MVNRACTVVYTVTPQDSVREIALSPEFHHHKPDVLASARLVALCEWPCMDLLRERLKPHECSLGVWQSIQHTAPIPIGARIFIAVSCITLRRAYSEWQVTVHDEHEQVGLARLGFVTVDRADFERRRLRTKQNSCAISV